MPNRRRSSTQRAAPKLFRCTGYGNCDMVFTRSEHLARHERKHTGEKPYKCVVPGCGRMFSRFDNMMQHTQTHEKTKKSIDSTHVKKSSSTPIPTSTSHVVHGHHLIQHAPSLTPIKIESSWSEDLTNKQTIPDLVMATSMVNSRTLPLPTRRASFSSYSDQMVYPQAFQPSYSDAVPSSSYYYYQQQQQQEQGNNNIPRNRSSWPSKKPEESQFLPYNHHHHYSTTNNTNNNNYYYDSKVNHNNNHDDDTYSETMYRRSSISTFSSDSNLTSPVTLHFPQQEPTIVKRRISIDDLRLPIEHLRNIQLEEEIESNYNHHHEYYPTKKNDHNNSIDVTPAEYEALEGFSRFHSQSVIASHRDDSASASDSTPSPILRNNSPNMAAQVCAMRQRVMTQNESFSRR